MTGTMELITDEASIEIARDLLARIRQYVASEYATTMNPTGFGTDYDQRMNKRLSIEITTPVGVLYVSANSWNSDITRNKDGEFCWVLHETKNNDGVKFALEGDIDRFKIDLAIVKMSFP